MATTTTALTPAGKGLPFIGPAPSQDLWNTMIPRAEVIFSVVQGTVIEAAAGEDQLLSINCTLDPGFAYSLSDWSCGIQEAEVGDINDWSDYGRLRLQDDTSQSASNWVYNYGVTKPAVGYPVNATLQGAQYTIANHPFNKLIIPRQSGALLHFTISNVQIDGGPLTINYLSRFIQYDLNQAYRAIVNTPVLVR